jgi:hypothetical protein
MKFLKIKAKEYLQISVINFNNWNRIFERCMHILRVDLNMPCYEDLTLSLRSILRIVYPPEEINCNSNFSEKDELEIADMFLSTCLSFLIDTED